MPPQPGKGPFDHPTPRQDLEPGRQLRRLLPRPDPDPGRCLLHLLDILAQGLRDPGCAQSMIGGIDPDLD